MKLSININAETIADGLGVDMIRRSIIIMRVIRSILDCANTLEALASISEICHTVEEISFASYMLRDDVECVRRVPESHRSALVRAINNGLSIERLEEIFLTISTDDMILLILKAAADHCQCVQCQMNRIIAKRDAENEGSLASDLNAFSSN